MLLEVIPANRPSREHVTYGVEQRRLMCQNGLVYLGFNRFLRSPIANGYTAASGAPHTLATS